MESVTQNEIAKVAGVSQRAVAAVVGRADQRIVRVSEATRLRILKVAKKLGYRPQRQAQLLRGVKSGMIGVIKSIALNQSGVEKAYHTSLAVRRAGYNLLVEEILWGSGADTDRAVEFLLDSRVEGVLLLGGVRVNPASFQRAGIPAVSLGPKYPEIPHVGADHRQGMRDLVLHFLSLGHGSLVCEIHMSAQEEPSPGNWSNRERLAAFRETCAVAGLDDKESRVIWQPNREAFFDCFKPGMETARMLWEQGELPGALICANDLHAAGAQKYFLDRGIDIPGTLALAGIDNTAMGRYLAVPLTTVEQPVAEMANQAVELLVGLIRGEKAPASVPKSTLLPCELVIRDSCGAGRGVPVSEPLSSTLV